MAGELIHACRGFSVGGAAVAGGTHANLVPATKWSVDIGSNQEFDADALVTAYELGVELYGIYPGPMLGLLGSGNASVEVDILGLAGALETLTVDAVDLVEPIGEIVAPDRDEGGQINPFGVRGWRRFAAGETFADAIAAA